MIASKLALPTPPSSPKKSKGNDVNIETHVSFLQAAAVEVEALAEPTPKKLKNKEAVAEQRSWTIADWLRNRPVYVNLDAILADIGYTEARSSPYKNWCMLFSYLLCTGEIAAHEQEKR